MPFASLFAIKVSIKARLCPCAVVPFGLDFDADCLPFVTTHRLHLDSKSQIDPGRKRTVAAVCHHGLGL